PAVVLDDDLRVQVALVLHDDPALQAGRVAFLAVRLAFLDLVEADLAADLGEDRDPMRVPAAQHLAGLDLLPLLDVQDGTVGNGVAFEHAVLGAHDRDLAVAGQSDALVLVVDHRGDPLELDGPGLLRLDLVGFDGPLGDAADVEGTHG